MEFIGPIAGDADLWIHILGRVVLLELKKNIGRSGARQNTPHRKGQKEDVSQSRSDVG